MPVRTHSTPREGALIGLIGGVAVALWHLILDSIAGEPFRTPNLLGQILLGGTRAPAVARLHPGAILGYAALHFAMFVVMGIVLTGLVHLVIRERVLRMGLWLAFVLAFAWLGFHAYLLTPLSGYRASWWTTAGGAVIGAAAIALTVWWTHPDLRRSLRDVPLADEVETPPAPPARAQPLGRSREESSS